ncbi:MAG TPA: hypothetical protein DCR14_05375 [Acidimicrobiaceae bacterium]|nr:hypothetical protein [Acidimicrobiaceae bacterium]
MSSSHPTLRLAIGAIAALSLVGAACGDDETTSTTAPVTQPDVTDPSSTEPSVTEPMATDPASTTPLTEPMNLFEGELVGLFAIAAGQCVDGTVTGSWFQMVQPGGTADAGPYVPNGDSACADTNYSLLSPGMAAGLRSGELQVAPDPAFDESGNGLAADIFAPVPFFGVAFAGAMDAGGPTPAVTAADGELNADLTAFTAYYGGGTFNQGAVATGTIDPMTGEYVLEWTSLISGGSFDGFTGVWHLEGVFTPAG